MIMESNVKEVFNCKFLAEEGDFTKKARQMFSKLETTDWDEHVYNNTIGKVFIVFPTSSLPIETIVQAGSVINGLKLSEERLRPQLDRLVKAKLLRKRKGKQHQSGVTLYEVNFAEDI